MGTRRLHPRAVAGAWRASFSGLPATVWWLAMVSFVNRVGTMVLPFLSLYLTRDQGWSMGRAGMALSVYGAGACAGTLLGGWLTDRFGARRVMLASLLGGGASMFALGHTHGLLGILALLAVLSVISESFRPAAAAAVSAAAPPGGASRAFALQRLTVNAGMTVSPIVGGHLAVVDYQLLFYVDGFTCWGAALLLLGLGTARGGGRHAPEAVPVATLRSPWRDGTFLVAMGLMTLVSLLFFQVFSVYPVFLSEHRGLREDFIGNLWAINTVLIVLLEMPLVHALQRRRELPLIGLGSALVGLGLAILPLSPGIWIVLLSTVIWTLGEMLLSPLGAGWVAHRAGDGNHGRYMAVFHFTFALGHIIGPAAGALVYQGLGPDVLWGACGVVGLIAWLAYVLLDRRAG